MNEQTPKNYVDVQRHAAETLRKLEGLKIKHADSTSTRFERVCNTVSNWLIGTSGVLFLLICGAGFVIGTDEPVTGWVRLVVLSLILLCLLAAFARLALQIITVVVSVLLYRSTAPELRAAQFSHDIENAKALAGLPPAALDLADDWLGQKIKRIDRRLSFFFGGSEKLALFALIGTCWAVGKEILSSATFTGVSQLALYGVAGLAGMAMAGVSLRVISDRLAYHRDIIALAKKSFH